MSQLAVFGPTGTVKVTLAGGPIKEVSLESLAETKVLVVGDLAAACMQIPFFSIAEAPLVQI